MKHEEEATQLRNDLQVRREAGATRGRGYPAIVRARVVAYAAECRKRNESVQTIAERLGMSSSTLSMWVQAERRGDTTDVATRSESKFAPVRMMADRRVKLVSPAGWFVEIDVETLVALVTGRR